MNDFYNGVVQMIADRWKRDGKQAAIDMCHKFEVNVGLDRGKLLRFAEKKMADPSFDAFRLGA